MSSYYRILIKNIYYILYNIYNIIKESQITHSSGPASRTNKLKWTGLPDVRNHVGSLYHPLLRRHHLWLKRLTKVKVHLRQCWQRQNTISIGPTRSCFPIWCTRSTKTPLWNLWSQMERTMYLTKVKSWSCQIIVRLVKLTLTLPTGMLACCYCFDKFEPPNRQTPWATATGHVHHHCERKHLHECPTPAMADTSRDAFTSGISYWLRVHIWKALFKLCAANTPCISWSWIWTMAYTSVGLSPIWKFNACGGERCCVALLPFSGSFWSRAVESSDLSAQATMSPSWLVWFTSFKQESKALVSSCAKVSIHSMQVAGQSLSQSQRSKGTFVF